MADEAELLSIYQTYKQEAEQARFSRMQQNKINFDMYNLRQDYSAKQKGQSKEFLPKQAMAVEQTANFMQQGLVDMGDWFKAFPSPGLDEDAMRVKPSEVQKLVTRQLEKARFMMQIGDAAKLGLLGSLMIGKIHGQRLPKYSYKVEKTMRNGSWSKKLVKSTDKRWQLKIDLIRQEDFKLDPSGRGLYFMQDIYMDYYEAMQLAEGKDAIYDKAVLEKLKGETGMSVQDMNKARETGQNISSNGFRNRIKLTEIWGNFVNRDGELLYENCVATIGNDRLVVQKPTANPLWHGEHPYVICPILTVPNSVWGKALMDAPSMLNIAQNEMFNLILDGGMMSVHGIKQIHENWLEDPQQVEDGITAGDTLRANSACPPGAHVLERIDTATVPQDGIQVYNLLQQEFNTAAVTNDMRMGVQPFRQVKATEIVESSQAITSMFSGIVKHIEQHFIMPLLQKSWATCAQHMDDLDSDELASLLGEKRAHELQAMGPEELFAETVQGCKFEVFGISAQLNKQKDFTKLQAMLQTIAGAPILMEEFSKKYDFSKLLGEIMKSLDINTAKIEADDAKQAEQGMPQGQPGQTPQQMPDAQSQIPQAGAAGNQGDMSPFPKPDFPASRATPRAG